PDTYSDPNSFILSGQNNRCCSDPNSCILSGQNNRCCSDPNSFILSGQNRRCSDPNSFILSGQNRRCSDPNSFILSGQNNRLKRNIYTSQIENIKMTFSLEEREVCVTSERSEGQTSGGVCYVREERRTD
ncbi:hypothetical protein J4Q44_G00036980, partial [Coregonus suidteri]